ncbi:phosphoglycolate phosphatase [Pseudoroseomonas rhizosphaerae]|uniref:Phosphoglycolate phosphatase n=1 Tax=Teichococcus rhizosphaerae TaxID=1335062 RepID=A0A2C7A433_9PROT|nr:HAD family phosphatase [Pseudoroseomonas rhizosphaerae]PHK94818.1 phosphoglycolate phosphatase [Pseudoroseomonas rhizosphaerae]
MRASLSPARPAAILFDCDGVLADSEALAALVVSEELTELGWPVAPEACQHIFLGRAVPDMMPLIEQRVGRLPDDWPARMSRRLTERMARDVVPVPGALATVAALAEAGVTLACASNSSRAELAAKLGRLGLDSAFGGRVFSFEDVDRPKPHPDIYRAAARACGAAPEDCVVVEDSLPGIRAGRAAGCRVLALVWDMPEALLRAEGAEPFRAMAELPGLLGLEPLEVA